MSAQTGKFEVLPEGRVICGAEAANCICDRNPHPEDPVHTCGRQCTGQWTGEFGTITFQTVQLPFPVNVEQRRWPD